MKRRLITGQRFGKILILMEIETKNSRGVYDVITFCFACRRAKRVAKANYAGMKIVQNCGCLVKKRIWRALQFGMPPIVQSRPEERVTRRGKYHLRPGSSLKNVQ